MLIGLHALFALLSGVSFFARGIGRMRSQSWVQHRWARITPHIIDAVLLLSAITIVVTLNVNPLEAHWVLAKIIALVFYVIFGVIAFRIAKTKRQQMIYWLLAMFVFVYIVAVAATRNALVFI